MNLLFQLYLRFFQVGLFAVGGGMATVPFLYDMSDATGWFTYTELENMIAVSESTPGPIGVNMATYVGYLTGLHSGNIVTGILGAATATLGLITPSIVIILIIAGFLKSFRNNPYVANGFYGLRAASAGLIAAAGLIVAISNLTVPNVSGFGFINWKGLTLALFLWLLTNKVRFIQKLHPIFLIAFSALIGIVFSM